ANPVPGALTPPSKVNVLDTSGTLSSVAYIEQVQQLSASSYGGAPAAYTFAAGKHYLVTFVGDPTAPPYVLNDGTLNPAYDGYGAHVLLFPIDDMNPPAL